MNIPPKRMLEEILESDEKVDKLSFNAIISIILWMICVNFSLILIEKSHPSSTKLQSLLEATLLEFLPAILGTLLLLVSLYKLHKVTRERVDLTLQAFGFFTGRDNVVLSGAFIKKLYNNYDSIKVFSDHLKSQKLTYLKNGVMTEDRVYYTISSSEKYIKINKEGDPGAQVIIPDTHDSFEVVKLIIENHQDPIRPCYEKLKSEEIKIVAGKIKKLL